MAIVSSRIRALVIKELLTLFRDPKVRLVLVVPPLLQLCIFSYAATMEVKNISVAVYNQDTGKHGQEIVSRIGASPSFSNLFFLKGLQDAQAVLDEQRAIAVLHIPQDFSRRIEAGKGTSVQALLDGRRSNSAQIVNGYLTRLISQYAGELSGPGGAPPVTVVRNWFNENLLYLWFTVPSLVGILSTLITLMVTSLSVAREKEVGTFDQLLVSPLLPHEILIGKTVPAVAVGLGEGLLICGVSLALFQIPLAGSFLLLCLFLTVFVLSVVGVGLFISSLAKTQQQAILGAFVFMVVTVTLSGFAAPVENMPDWLQKVTWINPVKYGMTALKGLFLKAMPLAELWSCVWPLLCISVVSLLLAGWFFTKRLE